MKRLTRIFEVTLEIVSGYSMAWLIFILMGLVLVEVVTRYVLRSPLMLADEMGAYAVVAITFVGLAYTWKERRHVTIDFVVVRLPTGVRKPLRLITLIIVFAVTLMMVVGCYGLVVYSYKVGARSESLLRLPLQWPQMVMVIGAVLLLLQLMVELVKRIRNLRTLEGKAR